MPAIISPDTETFSTPPTSPTVKGTLPPSLSRRNSRPTTLQIDRSHPDWNSDIVLEEQSPDAPKSKLPRQNGQPNVSSPLASSNTVLRQPVHPSPSSATMPAQHSPCFVHSHLDKGASLADWLSTKHSHTNGADNVGVSKSLRRQPKDQAFGVHYPEYTSTDQPVLAAVVDEEEDYGGSLTRQLAETAVGVREMSKQLGE